MHMAALQAPGLQFPWHAWVLGALFALFGLASGFDHVMSLAQGASYYHASGMTEQQVAHFTAVPFWAVLAWSASVWAGLMGAVALLVRRRAAWVLFAVSVAGSLGYIAYSFLLSAGREAMGVLWPMPFVVTALTAGMAFYCWRLGRKGVLR
ncbi:MAG TPA: hypothetical protein VFF91_02200 [Pseudoxanthomonas sp.]|nr:hypothetical protein [Pseudoxanthomonas sp.]